MRKFIVGTVAALMTTAGCVAAAPAQAAGNAVDITSITVPSTIAISSTACRNIGVSYTVDVAAGWEFWGADVEVSRNSDTILTTEIITSDGLNPYLYCPYFDGLGSFTFGPSYVTGWSDAAVDTRVFADGTRGKTQIKLKSLASVAATRSGSRVTFTAKTARFVLSEGRYQKWNAPKFVLQKQRADGSWGHVTTLTYSSMGVAKKTITAASSARYRVLSASNSWIWGAASPTIRK